MTITCLFLRTTTAWTDSQFDWPMRGRRGAANEPRRNETPCQMIAKEDKLVSSKRLNSIQPSGRTAIAVCGWFEKPPSVTRTENVLCSSQFCADCLRTNIPKRYVRVRGKVRFRTQTALSYEICIMLRTTNSKRR